MPAVVRLRPEPVGSTERPINLSRLRHGLLVAGDREDAVVPARLDEQRARRSLVTLESGQRMARTNDKGEREVLDDKARAEETKRTRGIIASECK